MNQNEASKIVGVTVRPAVKHADRRGWLMECFRMDEIPEDVFPVMGYISETVPGAARGPHEHLEQTDYFCFYGSSAFRLYLWDNRKSSPTYMKKAVLELDENEAVVAIIPPGVVHAYKNVGGKPGMVLNFPNRFFAGRGKKEKIDEVRYENDPENPFFQDMARDK